MVAQPLKQHLSRHLERAFTPRSAMAVGCAMDQLTQQLAQEEEAQPHQMPPALAALQRGKPCCVTPATLLSELYPTGRTRQPTPANIAA